MDNLHGLINALSNTKRAIDCQVDKVLCCFGMSVKKPFPAKLLILKECGSVSPDVLRKIVRMRNYLEHEYKHPNKDQVEDAIGIASLFIEASNQSLTLLWDFCIEDTQKEKKVSYYNNDMLYFKYKGEDKYFEISGFRDSKKVGNVNIYPKDDDYIFLIKMILAVSRNRGFEEPVRTLLSC